MLLSNYTCYVNTFCSFSDQTINVIVVHLNLGDRLYLICSGRQNLKQVSATQYKVSLKLGVGTECLDIWVP